jgi:hypothetical protein
VKIWDLADLLAVDLPMTLTDKDRPVIDYAKLTAEQQLVIGMQAAVSRYQRMVEECETFNGSMFVEGAMRTTGREIIVHGGVGIGPDWELFVRNTSLTDGKLYTAFECRRPSGKAVADGLVKYDPDDPRTLEGADYERVTHSRPNKNPKVVDIGFAASGDDGVIDFEVSTAGRVAARRAWRLRHKRRDKAAAASAPTEPAGEPPFVGRDEARRQM